MKLADLSKDELIAKLKATKKRHRTKLAAIKASILEADRQRVAVALAQARAQWTRTRTKIAHNSA